MFGRQPIKNLKGYMVCLSSLPQILLGLFLNALTCLLIIILLITTSSLVKGVRIRSYSGLYFPAFGLNTESYGVCLRIQSECQKIRTRITPNTDTFHAVLLSQYDKQNKTNRADYSQILSENVRDQKKGRERERETMS